VTGNVFYTPKPIEKSTPSATISTQAPTLSGLYRPEISMSASSPASHHCLKRLTVAIIRIYPFGHACSRPYSWKSRSRVAAHCRIASFMMIHTWKYRPVSTKSPKFYSQKAPARKRPRPSTAKAITWNRPKLGSAPSSQAYPLVSKRTFLQSPPPPTTL
jgi:hypothetical protein